MIKTNANIIFNKLNKEYPDAQTALINWENEFQLLVSIILSAQTTDKQVNKVTAKLFKKYVNLTDFANVDPLILENDIRSIGFFRHKAANIINAAKKLLEIYKGIIPKTIEQLIILPGVGRKTANVFINITTNNFHGIAVDTHVNRLSNRLGLTKHSDPEKIEKDLIKLFSKEQWGKITLLLIEHGRKICKSQNPLCKNCVLNRICPSAYKIKYNKKIS